jgi:hypothetical protein
MYEGNVGVARFPDFSPMSQLEIWCKIYFGHSLVIVFSGRKLLPELPMEHPLTQTGLLAYAVGLPLGAAAKHLIQIRERPRQA